MEKSVIDYKNYHRDKHYEEFKEQFINIFRNRFNLLRRFIGKGINSDKEVLRVLDIGCSNGLFLDLFKEKGWETWGVDPSSNANIAKKKGHKVTRDIFENVEFPANYFDLVIMNHTLEHMDNPSYFLSKIYKLLKNNGILFVDVPNAGGVGARLLGKHWPYLAPDEHKQQFTRKTLSDLFKKNGFKIIHFESRSGLFEYANPISELWQALTGMKKRFFTDILTLPFSFLTTLFNAGDSMSLIGKKIR
jgi:2-polyprenyl-3-methyl-5-hydroxy-6-metoxy-1,4-benzoquinol methylase